MKLFRWKYQSYWSGKNSPRVCLCHCI